MRGITLILLFALAAYGQQQRVAILGTVDDGDSQMEFTDLSYLTARLREIAVKTLPKNNYSVMTQQNIIDMTGSKENADRICKEAAGCLAQLGRKINADYVGQARLGRFGGNLTINMELYHSASGNLIDSFTGEAKSVSGLLAVLNEKAPAMFKKMPGVSGRSIEGGIGGLTKSEGYELDEEKRYVVNLSTEPPGAILSFDGVASAKCKKTPCKLELREGSVRIIANLEQYEIADTTVTINQNNQSIAIKLKPNFGVLEIKPAYLEDIGRDRQWSLSINDKPYSLGEIRLSPNKYSVRLGHECYENIGFEVGINKGSREVFDMASNITLKKGGLILSAERSGEPVSESVFVNGKHVGETPFSDAVPLCAKIEVGYGREAVDVELKYNEKVRYTYKVNPYEPVFSGELYAPASEVWKPIKTSFWVALGLDVLGVAFISYAVYENGEMNKAYDRYSKRGQSPEYYEDARKEIENNRSSRNMFYVIGGAFLASGIGVHIWF